MEFLGYIAAIIIGIILGLIGGGGSILTVPILVYIFQINPVLATSYSLFVVGITSIIGSISYFRKGLVNIKTAIAFAIPSIIAVYITRAAILPAIPEEIFTFGNFILTKNLLLMLLFALLMILAAYKMISQTKPSPIESKEAQQFNYPLLFIQSTIIGMLTGLVGAGGGFLIIPALVILSKLPIKEAIGTSLVIISANSLIGFWGKKGSMAFDWSFLALITTLAIIGIFIGIALSKKIDGNKLKPAFGWFVLAMGIYIIIKETILK